MAPNRAPAERRREFVAAARIAIAKKGGFGVTIRDVAREAGVSPGAILYHYKDFDALLLSAWEHLAAALSAHRQYLLEVLDDGPERLAAALYYDLPRADDESYLLYAGGAEYAHNDALRTAARAQTHGEIALYQTILEAGAAAGSFTLVRPSIVIARGFVAMTQGLGIWIVNDDPQIDFDEGQRIVRAHAEEMTGCRLPPAPEIDVVKME